MRPLGFDVDGVEGLAGDHEEAVSFFAAEAEVTADFGEFNESDALAFGGKDLNAVVAGAGPTGGGPDVAVDVGTDAVGTALFAVEFHRAELFSVGEFGFVHDVPDFDR